VAERPLPDPALARLAEAHGVMTHYDDWADERVDVPAETVVAVLRLLGVDASSDESVAAALHDAESAASRRVVDPTVVVTPGRRTTTVRTETVPILRVETDAGASVPVTSVVATAAAPQGGRPAYVVSLPDDLPLGYHRLVVDDGGVVTTAHLVVAPDRCPGTEHLGRVWGWMVQLYAVRSSGSWGVGDYADLAALARWSGASGADLLLCNPLHAAAPPLPQVDSPYSPSSRRFRHAGSIRVTDIPELARLDPTARARVDRLAQDGADLNATDLLDRDATARLQREALELVHAAGRSAQREAAFASYRAAQGRSLEDFARWCALAERHGADWTAWPEPLRRPDSPEVAAAAAGLSDQVGFHAWLQWVCDEQLAAAQAAAQEAGQRIGIVHDLAVGVSQTGADAWALQDVLALDATVGAPPDSFNQRGQDWALPPMRPDRLAESGYAAFREVLRSVLRHAGGIRIDHAMGLFRLYWIPAGRPATDGTYVRYPADDLLAVLALESHLAGAVVVAEDLGTVEAGVPEALAERHIHGSAVLWFAKGDDGAYLPPAAYREDTFASVTTHDLPTARGFWTGEPTRVRAQLHQLGAGRTEADQRAEDDEDRRRLLDLLRAEGLDHSGDAADLGLALPELLARSSSRLLGLSLADALGEVRQPNLPGTTDEYPNWRLPLAETRPDGVARPLLLDDIVTHPGVRRVIEIATRERPRP